MPRQAAFRAAHVQNLFSGSDDLRNMLEFRPGAAGSGQNSPEIVAPMKLAIKCFVTREHRFEKGEPARRFPQPEMLDVGELALRRNSESSAP